MVSRDIESSKKDGYEYQLKAIAIENKNINLGLELHFQPSSKAWLAKDAYTWLFLVAVLGLDVWVRMSIMDTKPIHDASNPA